LLDEKESGDFSSRKAVDDGAFKWIGVISKGLTVTVLWHGFYFSTPYFWGDLYIKMLNQAKQDGAQICKAVDAVDNLTRT